MKKIALIAIVCLALSVPCFAKDKEPAETDANRNVHWMAAYDVVTIVADTAIEKGIVAICPETDVNVYFGTDDTNDFLIPANTIFAVHQGYTVKLKTNTVCLVY